MPHQSQVTTVHYNLSYSDFPRWP